jgi:hypothetical protein
MSNQVTITPDEQMQKLAQDACDVQDAVNGLAVAGLLQSTMVALRGYKQGGDWCNQHPIIKSLIDKMMSLARMDQTGADGLFHVHTSDLAEGKAVTIEITPI